MIEQGIVHRVLVCALTISVLMSISLVRNAVWHDHVTLSEDVIEKSPAKTRPHIELGADYTNLGMFDKAAREYSIAISIDPKDPLAHYNLANLYYSYGYLDHAIEQYQAVLSLEPNSPWSRQYLGIAYYRKGMMQEARRELEAALAIDPNLEYAKDFLQRIQYVVH